MVLTRFYGTLFRRQTLQRQNLIPNAFLRSPSKRAAKEAEEKMSQKICPPAIIANILLGSKAPRPATFLSRQILANLKRFPHCLLLTRVGQFYESYFDQAVEISRLLNIKLTSRKWNGERHLKTLVQQEKRFVAMCEEFPRHSTTNVKEFDRRITRIITPGTLIDESFLNPFDNNYLLAINPSKDYDTATEPVGLAWIDVSTGEFFSKQCTLDNVQDELARIGPREVVLDKSFRTTPNHPLFGILAENGCLVSYITRKISEESIDVASRSSQNPSSILPAGLLSDLETATKEHAPFTDIDSQSKMIQTRLSMQLLRGTESLTTQESLAIQLLTSFLQENLLEHMPLLDAPVQEGSQQLMQIDSHTIQGLEIRESHYEGSSKGSLLSVVKRTLTSGGARLLARWLCSPSTSVPEIKARQSLVAIFRHRTHFRMDICEILKEVDDVGRLCQRFLLGRADFSDLVAIHSTIEIWSALKKRVEQEKSMETIESHDVLSADGWGSLDDLFSRMNNLKDLSEKISNAIVIDSDGSSEIQDLDADENLPDVQEENLDPESLVFGKADGKKWTINPNCSEKSARLHATLQSLIRQKDNLEQELRLKYSARSLTLRSSPGQGMFIHLSRARRDKRKLDLESEFYDIGQTLNTKSYFYRDWSHLGNKIVETSASLASAEKDVFERLRLEVIENFHQLRQNAQIIDELDVAISFALLATEMNFVRPEIRDDGSYCVINGRHPTVEMGLLSSGRQFTPNSVDMSESSNMHIITGPNMAGKSTLLRQTALISILAQVGSFVPADYAHIGVVDKLFSRIGARDDLFRDRSTFMVEMLETADILRRATEKSLVIMDEVGRGTTVKDGLAIAFATLHHLATVNKSRCLFATHFHELAEMVGIIDNVRGAGVFHNVRFYCSDVDDAGDGHFTYAYRLRPGINRDSHGLKVARLAGVPPTAMAVATDTLAWLRAKRSIEIDLDYDNFLNSTIKSTL
ncbi:muts domain V-domain-containing protein [Flammula alnicola]|nr:muts domain V-domain-containing protein [Flammula alnicola]